jgi:hypothetical protein
MNTIAAPLGAGLLLTLSWASAPAQFLPSASIGREGGDVVVSWEATPGGRYRLLMATNLSEGGWVAIANAIAAPLNFQSFNAPLGPGTRYFSVVEQEQAPPQAWLRSPTDRAIASGTNQTITIPLYSTVPIDTNTITLSVAGAAPVRFPDPRLNFSEGVLTYTPLPGETLGDYGQSVPVLLSAADALGNALTDLAWSFELEPPPVVSPNVVVVSNRPPGLVLEFVDGSSIGLIFSGASSGLSLGNILVSGADVTPFYRRRVLSFTELPDNRVVVETTDATVTHSVTSGGVQITDDFSANEAAARAADESAGPCCTVDLSARTVLSNAFLHAEVSAGRLRFTPRLALRGQFGPAGLVAADMEFGGTLGLDLTLRAAALAPGGYTNSIPLASIRQPARLDRVGTVPAWVETRLDFALGLESDWRGTGAVRLAIQSTNRLTVEAQLRNGAWTNRASRIISGRVPAPEWTTNLEAGVRVFVEVTCTVLLDHRPGPTIQARPFLEAEGFAYAPPGHAG